MSNENLSDYQKETGLESLPMRAKKENERRAKILQSMPNQIIVKDMQVNVKEEK